MLPIVIDDDNEGVSWNLSPASESGCLTASIEQTFVGLPKD